MGAGQVAWVPPLLGEAALPLELLEQLGGAPRHGGGESGQRGEQCEAARRLGCELGVLGHVGAEGLEARRRDLLVPELLLDPLGILEQHEHLYVRGWGWVWVVAIVASVQHFA